MRNIRHSFYTLILLLSCAADSLVFANSSTQNSYNQFNSGKQDQVQVVDAATDSIQLSFQWSSDLTPALSPSPRRWHSACLNPASNSSMIVFGGYNSGSEFNDVWEYNSSNNLWNQHIITSTVAPQARYGHTIVPLDSNRILLFGGKNEAGTYYGDTWFYNCSTTKWEEQSVSTSPSNRAFFSMARVDNQSKVVLFGGNTEGTKSNETWFYDIAAKTWSLASPQTAPAARTGASIAYDNAGKVFIFGGVNISYAEMQDLWSYDVVSSSWYVYNAASNAPEARTDSSMFYDAYNSFTSSCIVVTGGIFNTTRYNDIRYFVPITNSWALSNEAPLNVITARYGQSAVYIPSQRKSFFFGGSDTANLQETRYFVYRASGSFESAYIDVPFTTSLQWKQLSVTDNPQVITGTTLKFQLASSTDNANWDSFRGPDGNTNTFFTGMPPYSIGTTVHNNRRFIKYKAYFDATTLPKTPVIKSVTVTYNSAPNKVTLLSPLTGATTNFSRPVFSWLDSQDSDTGDIITYHLQVDNAPAFSSPEISTSGLNTTSFLTSGTTSLLTPGTWYWQVRAFDATAYGDWPDSYTLYVDTIAPNPITDLSASIGYSNGQIILSWTSPWDSSPSGNTYFKAYDIRHSSISAITAGSFDSTPGQNTGSFANSPQGHHENVAVDGLNNSTTYYFAVKLYDIAGNSSTISSPQASALTNAPPLVTIIAPSGGENWAAEQDILWSSADPNPGDTRVFSIYESFDGGLTFPVTVASGLPNGTTHYLWNTRQTCNGAEHKIKITATDERGLNFSTASAANFQISNINEAPSVSLQTPAGGTTISGTVQISWSVSDPNLADSHSSAVYISNDSGENFSLLSTVNATYYQLNTRTIPNGPNYRIKIIVTDNGAPPLSAEALSTADISVNNQNFPPMDFSIIYPASGDNVSQLNLDFAWENNGDPNPEDIISFSLVISTAENFTPSFVVEGISTNTYRLSPLSLTQETTYFWRVVAKDPLGLEKISSGSGWAFVLSRFKTTSTDSKLYAEITQGLPDNGYLKIVKVQSSELKAIAMADEFTLADRLIKPLNEDSYRLSVCAADDSVLPVDNPKCEIKFRYRNSNKDNYYDGTSVPLKNLRCALLNENAGKWETAPDFPSIDSGAGAVRTAISKLGVITLVGALAPVSAISGVTNFPNPFAAGKEETRILYVLTENHDTTIKIYTQLGDLVLERNYPSGSEGAKGQPTGYSNEIKWDGKNNSGRYVANGIYLLEIKSGSEKQLRKIGVVK